MKQEPSSHTSHAFGTFGGVFTPSTLTILGVIMFMRANFVLGQAGIFATLLILILSKAITTLTGLSISGISTNTRVRGGGAYFLISRSLGPEFGGAIGLAHFAAQALSVPFYILGFSEALATAIPSLQAYFLWISLGTALILFVITYIGADWAIRLQYVILTILAASIFVFLLGAARQWQSATFATNLWPAYTEPKYSFWAVFAIYFPAVTGINAGVNMSGDLKDPARSIPLGTLAAIGVGILVYAVEILVCGGAFARTEMIEAPFDLLVQHALFGAGFLVVAGVSAATLSSAIGSFMGAPRVLQALARDHIFAPLNLFAEGAPRGDEPRKALVLTLIVTVAVLVYAGNDTGGASLNIVAALITMFFLYAYSITNLAAFVESLTANPSFRPRFRFFHWTTALAGTIGCGIAAFLIQPLAALGAVLVIGLVFLYVRRQVLSTTFGDARRGFYYTRVRNNLLKLAGQPVHPKNWRPTILVLSGNPRTRLTLVRYALWLESQRGLVTLVEVLTGDLDSLAMLRRGALRRLQEFIDENEIRAFPEVVVARSLEQGVSVLLQGHSIGPIKPNIMLIGWPGNPERMQSFAVLLRSAQLLGMSLVCVVDRGLPALRPHQRIDVWWYGQQNGSLMLILAYLLSLNWEWQHVRIRLLRVVREEGGRAEATRALRELVDAARIGADVSVVVSQAPFNEVLHTHSQDATVVFLGLRLPEQSELTEFHKRYCDLSDGFPTTLLVYSSGDADLLT